MASHFGSIFRMAAMMSTHCSLALQAHVTSLALCTMVQFLMFFVVVVVIARQLFSYHQLFRLRKSTAAVPYRSYAVELRRMALTIEQCGVTSIIVPDQ